MKIVGSFAVALFACSAHAEERLSPGEATALSLASTAGLVGSGVALAAWSSNRLVPLGTGIGLIAVGLVIGPSTGRWVAGGISGGSRIQTRGGILLGGVILTLGAAAAAYAIANAASSESTENVSNGAIAGIYTFMAGAALTTSIVIVHGMIDIAETSTDVRTARLSIAPIAGGGTRGITLALKF